MIKKEDYAKTIDLTENYPSLPWETEAHGDKRIKRVLIPETYLEARVKGLAGEIAHDYGGFTEITVIAVLKGAFVFASDLIRWIHRLGGPDIKLDFIKASAYGKEIKGTCEEERGVTVELAPKNLRGRDILIVEDLIDQCFTLSHIRDYIEKSGANSVRTCILCEKKLEKPSRALKEIKSGLGLNYTGFVVPDLWIAGYGIDAGEVFRDLPYLVAVNEDYFR